MAPNSCSRCGTTREIHLCGVGYACQRHCPEMNPPQREEETP